MTNVPFNFFNRVAPNKDSRVFAVWNKTAHSVEFATGTWDGEFLRCENMGVAKASLDTWDAAWCLESALAGACTFFPF